MGAVLEPIPVTQQPSLSVKESIIEYVVGLGPTNGELLLDSVAITVDKSPPLMLLMLTV